MKKNPSHKAIRVSEIFLSLQGEGSRTGAPCVFIRLAGCSLGCRWCDTEYAKTGGKKRSLTDIVSKVKKFDPVRSVLVTGGEPLEQKEAVVLLVRRLLKEGKEVSIETNGVEPLDGIPSAATIILDVKTPSSGVSERFYSLNLPGIRGYSKTLGRANRNLSFPRKRESIRVSGRILREQDELKFVIADRKDFDWSVSFLRSRKIPACPVYFSAVESKLSPGVLGRWILKEKLPVRLMLRLHKILRIK